MVEFTRHLSVMLNAGVTIFEAVNFLKEQSKNKAFAGKLGRILDGLNNGQSLSNSMKRFPKVFSAIYTNIVQVGENSGTLSQTMMDLADHLEENDAFKKKIKSALIYPKIILFVMGVFLFSLFFFIMPRILTVFESLNADIPTATQVVMNITHFLRGNVLLVLLLIAAAFLIPKLLIKNKEVKKSVDVFSLKVPFLGRILLNYNTTQITHHFGTLFNSGLTIIKCLEITRNVIDNSVFQGEITYMIDKINSGAAFSHSFKDDSKFPPMLVKLVRVGERTGKLPDVVDYMRKYYKALVDDDVKNITTVIEPVIMARLGLMVAGFVITVIGPIYKLIPNIC